MIDRSHDLPIAKQAKALGISRGSVYSLTKPDRIRLRPAHSNSSCLPAPERAPSLSQRPILCYNNFQAGSPNRFI